MATIQIIKKETLAGRKYPLKYITFEKPDKTGVFKTLEKEVYYRPDIVAVLLADEKSKKILLCRQFRLPAFLNGSEHGYLTEVCAGVIEKNESPDSAACREAEEETGHRITNLTKVAAAYSSTGGITEFVHFYIAAYNESTKISSGGGLKEEGEDIELIEMAIDEAREKLKQGWFIDAKTIILLQHYFMLEQNK